MICFDKFEKVSLIVSDQISSAQSCLVNVQQLILQSGKLYSKTKPTLDTFTLTITFFIQTIFDYINGSLNLVNKNL